MDTGNSSHVTDPTKRMHHVIKFFSWWNVDRIMIFLLDSDAAAGSNVETVKVIDTSLTKIHSSMDDVPKEIMGGFCSGASGVGTREGLENEMMKQRSTFSFDSILTIVCACYGFNLVIAL